MPKGHVLTDEQRTEIIVHRMNGLSVRAVERLTGRARNTIVDVFREWREETAADRTEELAQQRDVLIGRHEDMAVEARTAAADAKDAGDRAAHARFMRQEREALREVARLSGADLPVRVEVSGTVDVNLTDDRDRLADYVADLCRSLN